MNLKGKRFSFVCLLTMLSALSVLMSCSSDSDGISGFDVTVYLVAPDNMTELDLSGHTVKFEGEGRTYTAVTDNTGKAVLTGVIPGVYSTSCSWNISSDEYTVLTSETVQNGTYILSGMSSDVAIATTSEHYLSLVVSKKQSILISKVYYQGCKDSNNKNYLAGRFVELYNNGDDTIDVSGLYVGFMETESKPAYTITEESDTVYMKQVFRIPADKEYLVAPGKNVVICNSAIDHTESGADIYNLLNADFEAKDASGKMTNNPNVPALTLVYTAYPTLSNMNLTQGGPCGVAIFNTTVDVSDTTVFAEVYAYGKVSGTKYKKIPAKYIIDGVDILKNKTTGVEVNTKRFCDYVDAGYVVSSGTTSYTGEVMYRKQESVTVDGRSILMDSNNSCADWAVATRDEQLQIGQYK